MVARMVLLAGSRGSPAYPRPQKDESGVAGGFGLQGLADLGFITQVRADYHDKLKSRPQTNTLNPAL